MGAFHVNTQNTLLIWTIRVVQVLLIVCHISYATYLHLLGIVYGMKMYVNYMKYWIHFSIGYTLKTMIRKMSIQCSNKKIRNTSRDVLWTTLINIINKNEKNDSGFTTNGIHLHFKVFKLYQPT